MFISSTVKHIKKTLSADSSTFFLLRKCIDCDTTFLVAPTKPVLFPQRHIEQFNDFMWHHIRQLGLDFDAVRHFEHYGDLFKFGFVNIPDHKKQIESKISPMRPGIIQMIFYPSISVVESVAKKEWYPTNIEFNKFKAKYADLFAHQLINFKHFQKQRVKTQTS